MFQVHFTRHKWDLCSTKLLLCYTSECAQTFEWRASSLTKKNLGGSLTSSKQWKMVHTYTTAWARCLLLWTFYSFFGISNNRSWRKAPFCHSIGGYNFELSQATWITYLVFYLNKLHINTCIRCIKEFDLKSNPKRTL